MEKKKIITYDELNNLISKIWLTTKDIMIIGNCGKTEATKVRKDIEQQILDMGKKIPISNTKHVPTELVLNYYGFDVEYIKKMASSS